MQSREGIFPTFFLSGFECSTFLWGKERKRRDLNEELKHYEHADEDYGMLPPLGIAVAREGIPWPLVDRGNGEYDYSLIEPFLAAQRRHSCRSGTFATTAIPTISTRSEIPTGSSAASPPTRAPLHVSSPSERITDPCASGPSTSRPWGYMGGEWGWCAPFGKSREDRLRFTAVLARADISACKAIRQDFPDARFVHIDPLIWVVPPRDRPDLAEAAHREAYEDAYLAWDIISGFKRAEYGGSLELIDILGLNNYSFGQMEYAGGGKPNVPLQPGDNRIRPVADLIWESWDKYKRPCIVAETSGISGGRPQWLNDMTCEALAAVNRGVDLHGICLFPAVDMTDWHNGKWLRMGIADVEQLPSGALMRKPFPPYCEMLRHWQKRLKRVTKLDNDPYDMPVNLEDIIEAAKANGPTADADWS